MGLYDDPPDPTNRHALVRSWIPEMTSQFPFPQLYIGSKAGEPGLTSLPADDLALGWATVVGFELEPRIVTKMTYQWPDNPNVWIEVQHFDTDKLASAEMARWKAHEVPGYANAFASAVLAGTDDIGRWHAIVVDRATLVDGAQQSLTRWTYLRRSFGSAVVTLVVGDPNATWLDSADLSDMLDRIETAVADNPDIDNEPPIATGLGLRWHSNWAELGATHSSSYAGASTYALTKSNDFLPAAPTDSMYTDVREVVSVCDSKATLKCINRSVIIAFADETAARSWMDHAEQVSRTVGTVESKSDDRWSAVRTNAGTAVANTAIRNGQFVLVQNVIAPVSADAVILSDYLLDARLGHLRSES